MLVLLSIAGLMLSQQDMEFVRVDIESGETSTNQIEISPTESLPSNFEAAQLSSLPVESPNITRLGSNNSPLIRARDIFELHSTPATAVTKVFQLDSENERTGQACTAQFIGPRHLITAAHCLFDQDGIKPGHEISIQYDFGDSEFDTVPVIAGYITSEVERRFLGSEDDKRIWFENPVCNDLAIFEIDDPLGTETGWYGLRATSEESEDMLLHNFSYPNSSRVESAQAALNSDEPMPPPVRDFFENLIVTMAPNIPDFDRQNLYYSYGMQDETDEDSLFIYSLYSVSGMSGSAQSTNDGEIVSIHSSWAQDYTNTCRLNEEWIGWAHAIMEAN